MHVLLSALGSAGDVHPFIAIGQVLAADGHDVRLLASPNFEARVRAAGLTFAPMGAPGEYERVVADAALWDPRRSARFILDQLLERLPEAYATTMAHVVPGKTLLVGSTLAWGTRLVHEKTGLPAATIHLSPLCLPSATAPPVLPVVGDLSWLPAPLLRWLQAAAERLVLDRWIGPRLNAFRQTLGLPPVQRIWSRWMHSPDLVLCAWPEWFAPTQPDWPPNAVTTAFPVFDEATLPLDAALQRFVDAGAPPIAFTPGSAMAHGRDFFAHAMAATGTLGARAVFVTAFDDHLPSMLPPNIHRASYAPFGALLPRLSALVHHGGIGTAAQALVAGLPQVVVPFAHDQFDNAARLRRLGVSTTLATRAPVADWVAALSGATAADTRAVARRIAVSFHGPGSGAARIAAELMRFGERQRPGC